VQKKLFLTQEIKKYNTQAENIFSYIAISHLVTLRLATVHLPHQPLGREAQRTQRVAELFLCLTQMFSFVPVIKAHQ
jgi:hypothetical protein